MPPVESIHHPLERFERIVSVDLYIVLPKININHEIQCVVLEHACRALSIA